MSFKQFAGRSRKLMANDPYARFKNLTFKSFQEMAADPSLTRYEKIGFPNTYREGKETDIFRDIEQKLTNLATRGATVLDIGPGCSDLPRMMIDLCCRQGHQLILVDSAEMLQHLPDSPAITKITGRFPHDCAGLFENYGGRIDAILSYSVLHYIFAEGSVFDFVDRSLGLLADGGEFLIGDIPNISKRKRFFSSAAGIRYHQAFTGSQETPAVAFNRLDSGEIDDSVLLSLMIRARTAGYDAYILPQASSLPMANRREDILIRKP